jgi:hypothetical protein
MKTPTTRLNPNRPYIDAEPLRFRAELPTVSAPPRGARAAAAQHDFLVPNPRPDLVVEPRNTLER